MRCIPICSCICKDEHKHQQSQQPSADGNNAKEAEDPHMVLMMMVTMTMMNDIIDGDNNDDIIDDDDDNSSKFVLFLCQYDFCCHCVGNHATVRALLSNLEQVLEALVVAEDKKQACSTEEEQWHAM